MQTPNILKEWTQREPATQIADRIGIDRGMVSRHINGHAAISAKHLASYLEAIPSDLKGSFLAAWLLDNIPPKLHGELLNQTGDLKPVVNLAVAIDDRLQKKLEFLAAEAMSDPDFRKVLAAWSRWMGFVYEDPHPGSTPEVTGEVANRRKTTPPPRTIEHLES
jgi:hypothetical protein